MIDSDGPSSRDVSSPQDYSLSNDFYSGSDGPLPPQGLQPLLRALAPASSGTNNSVPSLDSIQNLQNPQVFLPAVASTANQTQPLGQNSAYMQLLADLTAYQQ